jgi:NACalpha-BTF3-like transcription factor
MISVISKNIMKVSKYNKHIYEIITPKTFRSKVKKMSEKENEIESLNPEDIEIIDEKMHGNASGEGI